MQSKVTNWNRKHRLVLLRKRMFNAVTPAVLMALAVGQIYAFTLFSKPIADYIGSTQPKVQFAFSLGIFFLGMGAAFFGKIVEKNIRLSARVGMVFFLSGLLVTALGVNLKSLPLIYLGYGVLGGLGTGIIYISPVKTLMLWFVRHRAVAAAVPIISFGLGSSLCTVLFNALYPWLETLGQHCGVRFIFVALAAVYVLPMALSTFLLAKPASAIREATAEALKAGETHAAGFSYAQLLRDSYFLRAWLFMFLNISCGLALIPLAKQIMTTPAFGVNYSEHVVTLVLTGCGLMNGAGRLVFAWWSDRLARRINILLILLAISAGVTTAAFLPCLVALTLLVINACYGAGFSTIPAVLADHFGMGNLSKIHGAVLSAWGVAGLVGNQVSLRVMGAWGLTGLFVTLIAVYALNFLNVLTLKGKKV